MSDEPGTRHATSIILACFPKQAYTACTLQSLCCLPPRIIVSVVHDTKPTLLRTHPQGCSNGVMGLCLLGRALPLGSAPVGMEWDSEATRAEELLAAKHRALTLPAQHDSSGTGFDGAGLQTSVPL